MTKKLRLHSSFHSSTSVYQFCVSTPMNSVNYGVSSRRSLGRVSPRLPRISFPHGWAPRYAVRKRWICESQGWIMAGAVHRCKPGGGGRGGARWLGRICETIIESVRARVLEGSGGEGEEERWTPGMGVPRNNPSRIVALFDAERVSYDDVMARRDDEQANFPSHA